MTLDKLVTALLDQGAHRATYYKSEKEIVRATRTVTNWKGKRTFDKREIEIRIKMGEPNAREACFIANCKEAGETFPVRKAQFQFLRP